MSLFDSLLLPDNLEWAWQKVKTYYRGLKEWHDEFEIAAFESELYRNLDSISASFTKQSYRLTPLRPLPQPKKSAEDGIHPTRQAFWVSVRDQVAWMALVNVIGPQLDQQMPTWSYGNRLFRSVWFIDEDDSHTQLHIGRYRHTSGHLYRKFNQSWPVFRRQVYLTARTMAGGKPVEIADIEDPATARVMANDTALGEPLRLPFLRPEYWRQSSNVFWAGLDFERFYPRLRSKRIAAALRAELGDDPLITGNLLDDMFRFRVNSLGFSNPEMETIGLPSKRPHFDFLPTGLMVAGFLANVALLDVDRTVEKRIKERQIAHFRYVDDHIILATSFESLRKWVTEYTEILRDSNLQISFNQNKIKPDEFAKALSSDSNTEAQAKAETACKLDSARPTPLMTQTLARISSIRGVPLELIGGDEAHGLLAELQHLLLADFQEDEIRQDTRVAFAASRIRMLAINWTPPATDVRLAARRVAEIRKWQKNVAASQPKSVHTRAELDSAQAVLKRLTAARNKQIADFHVRVLRLLSDSIARFPERLPLWGNAVTYCSVADLSVSSLVDLLKQCRRRLGLGYDWVRAGVHRQLCHAIIKAGASKSQPNAFLTSARKAARSSTFSGNRYYLEISRKMFAASEAIVCCEHEGNPPRARKPTKLARTTNRERPAWSDPAALWWAEQWKRTPDLLEPGPLWRKAAAEPAPASFAASIHAWYPWENKTADKAHQPRKTSSALPLAEWLAWASRPERDENDPRLSEWTSLEIVAQVGDLNRGFAPTGISLQTSLTNTESAEWAEWRNLIQKQAVQKLPLGHNVANDAERVRQFGVLLFCMLTRDLRWWQAAIELRRKCPLYVLLGHGDISPVSSWALAILAGSLAPRQRETSLLRNGLLPDIGAEDATNDPPAITTVAEAVYLCRQAQKKLLSYQITIQERQPRQLIPIHLQQITSPTFQDQPDQDSE